MGNSWQLPYRTGWINRSDWTNVHPGSNTTLNTDSYVTHNLNAPLPKVLVGLWYSSDGTDANAIYVAVGHGAAGVYGVSVYAVDNNNIKIQTGNLGFIIMADDGTASIIDSDNGYYQAEVWFLG